MLAQCLTSFIFLLFLSSNLNIIEGYSGDVINTYFSDTSITFNGFATGEGWLGFIPKTFTSADGLGNNGFLIKYDAISSKLYASLYMWSDSTSHDYDIAYLYLDSDHDDGDKPDADDYVFAITRTGGRGDFGYNDETKEWDSLLSYPKAWEGYYASIGNTWGAMWVIPMAISDNQRMGIAVRQYDSPTGSISNYPRLLHPFMPSSWAEVVFQKLDSSIRISSSYASVTYGQTTDLSVSINRTVSRGTITFQYKDEGGSWTDIPGGSPTDGRLSKIWAPPSAGLYSIRAIWSGDIIYRGSTSMTIPFTVNKIASSTSALLSTSTITFGGNVTITSRITPTLSEGTLIAEYSQDKTIWTQIGSSVPSGGSYSTLWTPPSAGAYYIRARWIGTKNYIDSTSMEQALIINKASTSLQLSVSPTTAQIDPLTRGGASIQVSGSIAPELGGITIMVTYTKPDGTTTTTTLTTTSAGKFTDTLTPNQAGTWSIKSSWQGNTNYLASSSSQVTVSVGENWTTYIAIVGIVILIVVAFIVLRTRRKQ